jgi:hypothetical protein
MAYGKRKKGGQRLMEMSKAATKKRIAKKKSRVGGKKYVTPLPKPKSTAGGRNRTALRTPKGTTIPKKAVKKKAPAKAGTMTDAKGRSRALKPKTGVAPKRGALTKAQSRANEVRRKNLRTETAGLQKTQKEQMAALNKAKLAGNMALLLTPGGALVKGASLLGKAAPAIRPLVGKGVSKLGKKVKSLFNKPKPKPKPKTKPKTKTATAADKKKSKRTEQGYADFRNQAREASRKNARRRGG